MNQEVEVDAGGVVHVHAFNTPETVILVSSMLQCGEGPFFKVSRYK